MTVFYTGNSGRSTGPHLDARVWDVEKGGYIDPTRFMSLLRVGDGLLTDAFDVSSGYQPEGRTLDGVTRPHHGIDYATPVGTAVSVDGGTFLSTFNDQGGGITNQYAFTGDDGRSYEMLLMHGSDANKITSDAAVTNGSPAAAPSPAPADRAGAKQKAQDYASMSKAQLDSAYDALRSDPAKAKSEGMAMHKAFFNKP